MVKRVYICVECFCACVCVGEEVSRDSSSFGANSKHWSQPPTLDLWKEPSRMYPLLVSLEINITCIAGVGCFRAPRLTKMALDKLPME